MKNKYTGNPNAFCRDMHEAAEYIRDLANDNEPEPLRWADVVDALASKCSEEGSTTDQDRLVASLTPKPQPLTIEQRAIALDAVLFRDMDGWAALQRREFDDEGRRIVRQKPDYHYYLPLHEWDSMSLDESRYHLC